MTIYICNNANKKKKGRFGLELLLPAPVKICRVPTWMSKPACSAPTTVAGPYPAEADSARTPAHQGCRANGSARRRRPASTPPAGQIPGLLLLPPPRRVRAPPFPRPSLPCPRARDNIFPAAASVGTQLHLTSQPPAWPTLTASPSSGSSHPAPPEKATALVSPPLPSSRPAASYLSTRPNRRRRRRPVDR